MALSSIVRAARAAAPIAVAEDDSDFIFVEGRRRRRAKCHPDQPVSKHGLCRKCYRWRNGKPKRFQSTYEGDDKAEQIKRLTHQQEGRCAVCRKKRRPLVLDHDHATGRARAMLCNPCNTALGLMRESPEAIEGLLEYAKACQQFPNNS